MPKNIDPLLNAEVLQAPRAMGRGDQVVVCDVNSRQIPSRAKP